MYLINYSARHQINFRQLFNMDNSFNPLVFISKLCGIFPFSMSSKNKFIDFLNFLYDIFVLVVWTKSYKHRRDTSSALINKNSLISNLGMEARVIFPLFTAANMTIMNFMFREKFRKIVRELTEFDLRVSLVTPKGN